MHLVYRSLRLESHSENHTLWQNSVGYADVRSGILGMYVARYGKHSPGFSDCPMVFRRWLLTNDDVGGPILGHRNGCAYRWQLLLEIGDRTWNNPVLCSNPGSLSKSPYSIIGYVLVKSQQIVVFQVRDWESDGQIGWVHLLLQRVLKNRRRVGCHQSIPFAIQFSLFPKYRLDRQSQCNRLLYVGCKWGNWHWYPKLGYSDRPGWMGSVPHTPTGSASFRLWNDRLVWSLHQSGRFDSRWNPTAPEYIFRHCMYTWRWILFYSSS